LARRLFQPKFDALKEKLKQLIQRRVRRSSILNRIFRKCSQNSTRQGITLTSLPTQTIEFTIEMENRQNTKVGSKLAMTKNLTMTKSLASNETNFEEGPQSVPTIG